MKRTFLPLTIILALCACGPILPQEEASRNFVLDVTPPPVPLAQAPLSVSLQINEPQLSAGLGNRRIMLRKNNQEMDYYAQARWGGTLPEMVQTELVEAFEDSKALQAVGNDKMPFHADLLLAVDVRDFQLEYTNDNNAPTAHVRLVARLIHASDKTVITTLSFDESEQAAANRMQEVVASLNTAFNRATTQLVAGIISTIEHRNDKALK